MTYRHYALRRVPGATALPSLFVDVLQPTHDGALVTARMSPSTAAPGRWQLPGGSVEPPEDGAPLDTAALRRNATRDPADLQALPGPHADCLQPVIDRYARILRAGGSG